jgi:hypothetical protein
MKKCVKCGEEKDLELFAKGGKYKDGRRGTCKKCHSEYMTKYYKDNPEKARTLNKIDKNWKRHHLSEEKYNELLSIYDGKCHSCKSNVATNIDHDHSCCNKQRSCGKCVRGVLCNQCNTALGLLSDDRQKIIKLLEYIK